MDRPTLRQLEYAVAVADHRHFGRAADACAVSQPGLSGQVQELERRLAVQLFERSGRDVRLTEAGSTVVERARRVLGDVDELTLAAAGHRDGLVGSLRVAAIPTMAPYLLPALVGVIRRTWPDLDLDLQELRTASMVAAVRAGRLDLGLLAVPFDTADLHVEPVGDEVFELALPDGHRLAGDTPLPIGVLGDLPVLLLEEGHCLREHALQACSLAGEVEHSAVHDASLSTLTQMVAGGVGVTLLPRTALAVEARAGNGIVTRPFEPPAPGRTVALAWRRTDPRAPHFARTAELLTRAVPDLTPGSPAAAG